MMPTNWGFRGPTSPPQQPTQTMQLPVQPPAEQPPGRRRTWLRWAIPLLAFLIGTGVGAAGDQADVTAAPQYIALQDDLEVAQDQASELSDDVAAAEEQVRQAAAAAQTQIEQQTAAITQRTTALDQREQDLVAREGALRAAEQTAASRTSSSSSSSSSSSGSVSSGAGSAAVVEPEPEVSVSASYANCTAARNAGAAPVRVGDPGYGRHLDRDGDGIGCE